MTLPSSGVIAMSQVNVELGFPATTGNNMNHPWIRLLAQVAPTGLIAFSNLYGKTGRFDGSRTTAPVALSVDLNAPWWGGTIGTLQVVLGGSPEVDLFISGNFNWTGPILVINNSTGVSARLVFTVDGRPSTNSVWKVAGNYTNLVRSGATDSFTAVPTT